MLTAFVAAAALALVPATAEATLYWNQNYGGIARSNNDGSLLDADFVAQPQAQTLGVAAGSGHVYWSSGWDDHYSISRADLDGTHVQKDFIDLGAESAPGDIAVDSEHVYWVLTSSSLNAGSIARADLNGTNVDLDFITAPDNPASVAVDGSHVYWSNFFPGLIGRADLDGSNVVANLVAGDTGKEGLAVGTGHIYWANAGRDSIGRADLDGGNVDEFFVSGPVFPSDVAVDAGHVYWSTSPAAGFVGRATLSGEAVDEHFILDVSASSLALDDSAITDTAVAGSVKAKVAQRQRRHIAIKLKLKAAEPITATVTGAIAPRFALRSKTVSLAAGEHKTVELRLEHRSDRRRVLSKLERGGARAKLRVLLTDGAENRSSEKLAIRLTA